MTRQGFGLDNMARVTKHLLPGPPRQESFSSGHNQPRCPVVVLVLQALAHAAPGLFLRLSTGVGTGTPTKLEATYTTGAKKATSPRDRLTTCPPVNLRGSPNPAFPVHKAKRVT